MLYPLAARRVLGGLAEGLASGPATTTEAVVWAALVGCTVDAPNTLRKTGGGGWNAGAVSTRAILSGAALVLEIWAGLTAAMTIAGSVGRAIAEIRALIAGTVVAGPQKLPNQVSFTTFSGDDYYAPRNPLTWTATGVAAGWTAKALIADGALDGTDLTLSVGLTCSTDLVSLDWPKASSVLMAPGIHDYVIVCTDPAPLSHEAVEVVGEWTHRTRP